MRRVELIVAQSKLIFEISNNGWTKVKLQEGDSHYDLGADDWLVLQQKFYAAFSTVCISTKPDFLLTLFEHHCSLYRCSHSGVCEYFWQDGKANEIWRAVVITPLQPEQLNIFRQQHI